MFNDVKKAIVGLSLGHFAVDLYAAILVPLYPILTTKLGMNLAIISSYIALGHLTSSLMQPVFGFLADKIKHRIFMVWGLVLSSIFIPLTTKATTPKIFLLCLLIGMLGNAFFHPQVSALIKQFNKDNPNLIQAMGVFLGLGTIGYAIGPYLATISVKSFGLDNFIYLSIFGIISAIFMYFFVPKIPSKEFYLQENFFTIIKEIFKNKACMFLLMVSVIKSAVSISFGTYIPFLLQNKGLTISQIGLIVTLFFISGGAATIFSSKIEKKLGANGVVVLSFLTILPLTLAFLFLLDKLPLIAIIIFILTGFFILLSVGVVVVQAQNKMPKYTGVISGVMQGFSWGLGAMFLAPMGFIGQNYGIDKILTIMALIAFVAGIYTAKNKCID